MVGIKSELSAHRKEYELHFLDVFPILPDVLGSLPFCSGTFSLAIDQLIFRLVGRLLPPCLCFPLCVFKNFSKFLCFQYSLGDIPLFTLLSHCCLYSLACGKAGYGC
ncbi:MAG: hypothetical protein ACMUIA_00055 [bacterium]